MSSPFDVTKGGFDKQVISDEEFHDQIVSIIREYRIWHLGMGTIGLLACGLILFGAVAAVAMGLMAGGGEAMVTVALGGVYFVMALMYGIPAGLLMRSGLAAMRVHSADDRESILVSMRMQKWLWRIVGVLTFAISLMYLVLFLAVVVFGMFGAAMFA